MPEDLRIALSPEHLDEGDPEEKAAFGMFTMHAGNLVLTEGFDHYISALRQGPLVSGYHAAEWFAWNWWRLLYEPYREDSTHWGLSHRLPAIGAGYVWPNIEIRSDGRRAVVISAPSSRPDAKPFRFLGLSSPWLGPSATLEGAMSAFIDAIIARLDRQGLRETNLHRLWSDVNSERRSADTLRLRRLEAMMGFDPDAADESIMAGLEVDARTLGQLAVEEIAADAPDGRPVRADDIRAMAATSAVQADRQDAARLPPASLASARKESLAWQQGKRAADMLRRHEKLGDTPIPTSRLLALLGATGDPGEASVQPLSFLLDRRRQPSAVVLRSHYPTGQRFDIARLLGDLLLFERDAPMLPATRAYTFRQKAQRSFAAELLSPFATVEPMLDGDMSEESIERVSHHFNVSPWTIRTLIRNNRRIERESLADAA